MGFQLGRRAEFCFLPIACVLLFIALFNVLTSTGSILLLFLDPRSHHVHNVVTRILLLFRATMGLIWGCAAISNATLFKRASGLARFTLIMNAAQMIPWSATFVYNLTCLGLQRDVSPLTWGVVQAFFVWISDACYVLFPHQHASAAVWLGVTLLTIIDLVYIAVTVDLSWSYYNVLYYGGTGWEGKAYQNLYGYESDEYEDEEGLLR